MNNKINNIKHKILLITVLSVSLISKAQDAKSYFSELVPPSPTVSELGKYGEVPVGKYNGTANAGVPIHQIDFENISIPINLNYNTSGVKVSQESSWVGLGWNLSANAVISRQIKGYDDLSENGAQGYLYSDEYTLPLTEQQEDYLTSINPISPVDLQPDEFTISLFGTSISFILPKKGNNTIINAQVLNDVNTLVSFDTSNQTFTVVDSKGYIFQFDSKEYSTQYRSPAKPVTPNQISAITNEEQALQFINLGDTDNVRNINKVTAWHLDKIVAPNNEELNFHYQRGYHLSYPSFDENIHIDPCQGSEIDFVNRKDKTGRFIITGLIISYENLYLSQITGDFGSVDFELTDRLDISSRFQTPLPFTLAFINSKDTPAKKLSSITVNNQFGTPVKTAVLNHSYFNSDENQDTSTYKKEKYIRLKLDSVAILDESFSFEYISPNSLPAKDSRSYDFWGFYNGKQNQVRIPSFGRITRCNSLNKQVFVSYEGADRSSDIDYGKIGNLSKIIYPTGGYTEFEYEANRATINKPVVDQNDPYANSTDFSYNYQYLKRAQLSNLNQTINSGDTFTINTNTQLPFDYNFSVTATITCGYQCNSGADLNQFVFRVENVNNPSQVYEFLSYGRATPSQGQSVLSERFSLPNGTYRLIHQPYVVSGSLAGVQATSKSGSYIHAPNETTLPFEEFEVGGVRIKSVTNKDHTNQFINKKRYTYTEGRLASTTSSGVLMNEMVFHSKFGLYDYTPQALDMSISSGSPLNLKFSAQGHHLGYSFIEEIQETNNGENNGKIRYNFRNTKNEHLTYFIGTTTNVAYQGFESSIYKDVDYGNTYIIGIDPISFDHENGTLFSEEVLDKQGNTKKFIEYNDYDSVLIESKTLFAAYIANVNIVASHPYQADGYISLLKRKKTRDELNNKSLWIQEDYTYNERFLPESSTTTTSENNVVQTRYTYYPFDTEHNIQNLPLMQDLTNRNEIITPVLQRFVKNNRIINEQLTLFEQFSNNQILPTLIQDRKDTNDLENRFDFIDYDIKGNPIEVSKQDGVHITYIWGYNRQYPVAKIENATRSQIEGLSGFGADFHTGEGGLSSTQENTLRTSLPNTMISTYEYKPLIGVTKMTDPRGYTMTYHYDAFNRLEYVKDAAGKLISENQYNYKN
ncbi:RHS repeat domain-containing protein [uncultured Aquimarina sp.]|uniref:RHS repeat domain-containing protein n=1 Tax=uncultured Aquimarina sp. TaxID=575652 RepID=UPI0026233029|nr:RHS repeat domain-containing protein [uncultured Aquimarina sp.]